MVAEDEKNGTYHVQAQPTTMWGSLGAHQKLVWSSSSYFNIAKIERLILTNTLRCRIIQDDMSSTSSNSLTTDQKKPNRASAVRFVLVTVFLDVLGIGIAIPVLPALVGELSGNRELQAWWYGVLGASYGLMQFSCSPLLGALSDRFWQTNHLIAFKRRIGLQLSDLRFGRKLACIVNGKNAGGRNGGQYVGGQCLCCGYDCP